MLFSANQFEHNFKSPILKKGLRLFEKGQVELLERQGADFNFLVNDGYGITVKKRGDKIISYTCNCFKTDYCEHLSACLFWFEKDTLGISAKKKRVVKKTADKQPQLTKTVASVLKEVDKSSLIQFIENYSSSNELFKETVLAWFSASSENTPFHYYSVMMKGRMASVRDIETLDQKQLDKTEELVRQLITDQRRKKDTPASTFYLLLAVLTQLPVVFKARMAGNETGLVHLTESVMQDLEQQTKNNLTTTEREVWMLATTEFLKSTSPLYEPVLSFLAMKAISFLKNKQEATGLKKLLEKKNLRASQTNGASDPLQTLRLALSIKESELFKTAFNFKKYQYDPELILARAGLYFSSYKTDKAFDYLNTAYENVKSEMPASLKEITTYIIRKAREKQKSELELSYLGELLVFQPHISTPTLERFLELIPVRQKNKIVDELLAKIREQGGKTVQEKISLVLLKAGRFEELKKELKKQNNRFNFVNTVAQQHLPDYDRGLISVYVQHLADALEEARYTSQQQPLFLLAKRYFDRLPEKTAHEAVTKLLDRVTGFKALHGFIVGYYPQAALGDKA